MQCYSGIRVSDMQHLLNPGKYRVCDGVPFVMFVPKKTNKRKFKEANIPLNTLYPQLLTLYEKYKGKTFKFLPTTDDCFYFHIYEHLYEKSKFLDNDSWIYRFLPVRSSCRLRADKRVFLFS